MRRWMHSMGTAPLSRVQASKYSNMSDFLGDPVRSETVFTLEEKLSELEGEEEDDRAMGRDPPAELAEVSCAAFAKKAGRGLGAKLPSLADECRRRVLDA